MTDLHQVSRYIESLDEDKLHELSAALRVHSPTLDPTNVAREWLINGYRPTWRKLIQALKKVGLEEEARVIQMEH